jgi:23S rRNA (pseudouridine1915-N3)-methyltransferase
MFKINIIAVGKNKDSWVDDSITHFLINLKKHAVISLVYTQEIKKTKSLTPAEVLKKEAPFIKKYIGSSPVIALSDKGRRLDSIEFSQYFTELMNSGHSACNFIIGGAYGIDESIMKTSRDIISLSPMTMSHQLIRPVLLEQIYRAFSIISGEKYHK